MQQNETESTTKKKTKRGAAATRARDWKPIFLKALAQIGTVSYACKKARVDRKTAYAEKKADLDFEQAWKDALEIACDELEKEARRRAYDGVDEPVFGSLGGNQGSGEIGQIRKYSNTLLIFLLKGNRPEKFRDRYEISGDPEKPLTQKHKLELDDASLNTLHELLKKIK